MDYAIYILATKSGTSVSRLIHVATAAPFTHVSIGLDGLDGDFYSFGRKYTRLVLPGGLVKEGVRRERGSRRGIRYRMYRLQVPEDTYFRVQDRIREMYSHRERYHYNILGAVSSYFHYPLRRQSHYFCSQFVAETLEYCGALEFDKNSALVYPMDLCGNAHLQLVSEGVIGRLGVDKALPAPSEVVAILPFGRTIVRGVRFCRSRLM